MRKATLDLFKQYQFPALPLGREVRRLSSLEQQIVEIAKALSHEASVLILDEPTSALGLRETQWLLGLSRRLAEEGRLVIFISHRMEEVRQIADRVTIFRNGRTVSTYDTAQIDDETIIADMLGRRMDRLYPERVGATTPNVALSVRD